MQGLLRLPSSFLAINAPAAGVGRGEMSDPHRCQAWQWRDLLPLTVCQVPIHPVPVLNRGTGLESVPFPEPSDILNRRKH